MEINYHQFADCLFQLLRRYDKLAQDRLRVFSSPCIEEMDEQLARESFPASRVVTAGAKRQAASRGDFWNLMTLAKP